jgi:segregation and condensation protein B
MASWQEIEAFLFASGRAHAEDDLARALGTTALEVRVLLEELERQLDGHGIQLSWQEGRVGLLTAPQHGELLTRALPDAPGSLSAAALEALTLIAYRQPITRGEIEAMRGVRSDRTLQTLLELGLVEVVGRAAGAARAPLYGTTVEFLRRFNLTSLDDLPELPQEEEDPAAT